MWKPLHKTDPILPLSLVEELLAPTLEETLAVSNLDVVQVYVLPCE
jgi:hypothetical protein